MKKFTAILLTVIMVASLFDSCDNSIAPTVTDETVSVSFTEATSRSLTASLGQFKAEDYYWAYKATKKDNTGLISGQTNFAWVKGNDKGLSGVTIPGFSQGLWEFTLYAYTKYEANESNLAYSGVTQAVLQKNSSNVIKVTVNPNPRGDGKLIIDVSNIRINAQVSDPEKFNQDNFTKYVTVTSLTDGTNKPVDETYTLNLPAGAYKVSVDIMESGKDLVYASGSVVATVYANMETKVSGSLDEYIVPAEFNPAINPDVMNKVVYSAPIDSTSSGDVVINKKSESETDNKVKATIPSGAAQVELEKAIEENKDSAGATTGNTSIAFTLTVDTTNATETTLNLEIGMNAVITVRESETSSKQISKEISSLNDYVTVEINLQTALRDVVVTHDSSAMQALTSLDETITNDNGAYYYDADSGLLTIKTKRFSPYAITYRVPEEAYVAEMNGVKYTSVQAAINAAPDNAGDSVSTISILNNVTEGQAFGFYDSQKNAGKNILIDLNGNTYTFKSPAMGSAGYESQAMHLASGNTLTVKNGTLNIAEDNDNMCMVIQNYCNLTLEDVVVDGTNLSNAYYGSSRVWGANYTASFNSPSVVVIKGNTQIIARPNIQGAGFENVAFDVDIKSNGSVTVDFDRSFTGKVEGNIEYLKSTDDYDNDHINIRGNGVINSKLVTGEGVTPNIQVYGGTFFVDPSSYVDFRYKALYNGNSWVISAISATEDDPIIITNGKQFAQISSGTFDKKKYYKLANDIDLSSIGNDIYVVYSRSNIVLDGNNCEITINDNNLNTNKSLFYSLYYSTIKNLKVNLDYSIIFKSYDLSFDNVDVYGGFNVTGNEGAYIVYAYYGADFINCNSYADLYGNGDEGNYNAVFVGYPYGDKFTFTNCTNEASIVCGKAAMFIANGSYANVELDITQCKNNGIVQSAFVTSNLNSYFPNYFRAVTHDGKAGSLITVTVDGTNYSGNDKSATSLNGDVIENILTGENGQHINGPADDTLALAINDDGTFTITPASVTGVAKYEISIGMYATIKSGGSCREFIKEEITATTAESYISTIKNLAFVDEKWVSEHPDAVKGTLKDYTIYTLNGQSYYYLLDPTNNTLNGVPRALTLFGVTAYDSNGKLIASAGLKNISK